ncbi:hypothetical protein H1C71_018322, partial [Ictidomys tridecemlineatus]
SSSSPESVSHSAQALLVPPVAAPSPPPAAPSAAPSSSSAAAAPSGPRASSWASGTFFFFNIFSNFFLSFSFFFSSFLFCSSNFFSIFLRSLSVRNFSGCASRAWFFGVFAFFGVFPVFPLFRGASGSASAAAAAAASAATSAAAAAVFFSLSAARALSFMAIFSMVARPPRGARLASGPGALLAPGLGLSGPCAPRVGGLSCGLRCAVLGRGVRLHRLGAAKL